jgi:hypothetical protein
VEELLVPDHAGEGLALDAARIRAVELGLQLGVERICLGASLLQYLVELGKRLGEHAPGQAQTEARAALPGNLDLVENARLGAVTRRIDGVLAPTDHILVERVLEMARDLAHPEQPPHVGVVVAEQQGRFAVGIESIAAEQLALDPDGRAVAGVQVGAVGIDPP